MDPLSQTIALLRTRVFAWQVIEAHDAWAIRFPAVDAAVFGQVMEGGCQAELANGAKLNLEAGDFLLFTSPGVWCVRTAECAEPIDFKAVLADPRQLLSDGEDPTVTRLMAGAFVFDAPNADRLQRLMPPVVHVRGADVAAGRLGQLLKFLGDEALGERPGRSLVLDRLLEVILMEAIRQRPAQAVDPRQGLLAGLRDPQIGAALHLMHAETQHPWTIAALARQVGMSRSSFAARFADAVGSPPIDYLLNWRMSLAKDALRSSKMPMIEVAQLAGYQSVSAFSTAFSRAIGCSPTAYMRALS